MLNEYLWLLIAKCQKAADWQERLESLEWPVGNFWRQYDLHLGRLVCGDGVGSEQRVSVNLLQELVLDHSNSL